VRQLVAVWMSHAYALSVFRRVSIKTLKEQTFLVDCDAKSTVLEVKHRVAEQDSQWDVHRQRYLSCQPIALLVGKEKRLLVAWRLCVTCLIFPRASIECLVPIRCHILEG